MVDFEKGELLFRPTVVVGLGGAGVACAARVREKILSNLGDVPFVQVLGIDTHREVTIDPLPKSDMVYMTGYLPRNMLSSGEQVHQGWQERLRGLNLSDVALNGMSRMEIINVGTYGNRPVGLMGFYVYSGVIRRALEEKVAQIMGVADRLDEQPVKIGDKEARLVLSSEGSTEFRVFIISSLGGGTGSGCFLDLAYLCRYLLRDYTSSISGVFLLPDVVEKSNSRRLSYVEVAHSRANAFAALTELDHLQGRANWQSDYPGGLTIAESSPPYDMCYLIGDKDEQGRVYAGTDRLYDKVAQGVFGFIDPNMAQVLERFHTNVSVLGSEWETGSKGHRQTSRRWFSSFNADSYEPGESGFPDGFQDYAAKLLVSETIEGWLEHQQDDLLVKRNRDFMQLLHLDNIIADFVRGITIPDRALRWSRAVMSDIGQNEHHDGSFLLDAGRMIFQSPLVASLEKGLKERLSAYVQSIEDEHGVGSVARVLELMSIYTLDLKTDLRLVNSLPQLRAYLEASVYRSLNSARQSYNDAKKAIQDRTELGFLGLALSKMSNNKGEQELGLLQAQRKALLDAEVKAIAGKIVVKVLEAVSPFANRLLRDYQVRQLALSRLSSDLRNELARADDKSALQATEGFFTEDVRNMSKIELSAFLEKYFKERESSDYSVLGLKEACMTCLKPLLQGFHIDWMEFVSKQDYLRSPFAENLDSIGRVIRQAVDSTTPLLRFDANRLPDNSTEACTIVGVSNAADHRIPEGLGDRTRTPFSLISTGRRGNSTLEVLSIRHGIPLGVVYVVEELKSAYDQLRKEGVSGLHIVRELVRGQKKQSTSSHRSNTRG